MQITLERLSNLERKLQVTIPVEVITSKVKTKLNEIAVKAKMPGFRPGKVPFEIIKNNYMQSAHAQILEDLIRETYVEALQKENLNPAGLPEIKIISSKPEEPFVYTATFEVYPEFKLQDFTQLEVAKSIASVADNDVDEMLEKMRKNHATWQEIADVSHKSKLGEQLTVDFTTKLCVTDDTKQVPTPKEEKGIKFVLGDGSMWTDFEQPLYGLEVGEVKQFILQMPETHMDKTIAGKRVEFTVKVNKIYEPILPALDDEFAAKMKIAEGGIAKLKKEVRSHMERELNLMLKETFKQAIMSKLLEHNSLEVPKFLVDNELNREAENWKQRIISSRGTLENSPVFPRNDFAPQAKRNVALGLLLSAIIKEQKITVDYQEVKAKITEMVAAYYDDSGELLKKLLTDKKRVAEIEAMLLEDKVVEYLASQVKCVEKNISYKDVMTKK